MHRTHEASSTFRRGYVLVLRPETLKQNCAQCYVREAKLAVEGDHFFLITDVAKNGNFLLTPLFTKGGKHRVAIPEEAMVGSEEFRKKVFHYIKGTSPEFDQVWVASDTAIAAAAVQAGDLSTPQNRNRIADTDIPKLNDPTEIQ